MNVVFIGGPLDGKLCILPDGSLYWRVPPARHPQVTPFDEDKEDGKDYVVEYKIVYTGNGWVGVLK